MEIVPVRNMLAPEGLEEPLLNALIPNENNYKALLLQPLGRIEASADGVRNKDVELAQEQFRKFLENAGDMQADLVITPEYSMPWSVLEDSISADIFPSDGILWILGCESIRYSELELFRERLAPFAAMLYEPLNSNTERFLSPLAYIFKAPCKNEAGKTKNIILVQFKTHPMGDPEHFEINGMQRGTFIYQFGGNENNLKLVSLICADVFDFQDSHARAIHDRALIIHIQLNPEPRHEKFLDCRRKLLGFNGDETEILCLNWAKDVQLWIQGRELSWKNIAGSAWYSKSKEFDDKDTVLCANHRRGLYYTWLKSLRAHALFLNFEPGSFLFQSTKVAHIGVGGPISKRRGPQLKKVYIWDDVEKSWKEQEIADDRFSAMADKVGTAKDEIMRIASTNPLIAERILALSAGKICHKDDWYKISRLESCETDASEIIYRLTYCQDTDAKATNFRTVRFNRLKRLWVIVQDANNLPPSIQDIKDNIRLEWSPDFPHQNVISNEGQRATIIYMGEDTELVQVEALKKRIAEYLHRTSSDPDQSLSMRQRLVVWYRDGNDQIVPFEPHRYLSIDQTGTSSEFDIGREA